DGLTGPAVIDRGEDRVTRMVRTHERRDVVLRRDGVVVDGEELVADRELAVRRCARARLDDGQRGRVRSDRVPETRQRDILRVVLLGASFGGRIPWRTPPPGGDRDVDAGYDRLPACHAAGPVPLAAQPPRGIPRPAPRLGGAPADRADRHHRVRGGGGRGRGG